MLRERLLAAMGWFWTRFALWIAPRPPLPPRTRFKVALGGKDRVRLLFVPCEVGGWHVVTVLFYRDLNPILVDAGVGRCWITPLPSESAAVRYQIAVQPDYVVDISTDYKGEMVHSTIGPVTCVTLAKRLIGIHKPGIVTSRQLLSYLWRRADGSA